MPPRKRGTKSGKRSIKRPKPPKVSQAVHVSYREDLATPDLPLAPIQRCPSDVLLIIFEFYLADNPRYIRRLLLVCKQWCIVVRETPQLWTHIRFRIPSSYSKITPRLLLHSDITAFVKACLKRAGNSLLHIDANFFCLEDYGTHFSRKYYDPEYDFFREYDDPFMDEDDFISLIDMQKAFSLLTGKNGKLMKRWTTLSLTLPIVDEDGYHRNPFDHNIWGMLSGPTPNLKLIEILGLKDIDPIHAKKGVLPDLSALRHLRLEHAIELPYLMNANIEILEIPIDFQREDWPPLCRLSSLRSLKLRSEHESGFDPRHDPEWPVLHLPNLSSILFDGAFIPFGRALFDLPSLKHVSFKRSRSVGLPYLPVLHPETVELGYSAGANQEELIRRILLQYPCIESFEVSASYEKECRDVIVQLKEDPSWSSSLKQVHFKSRDGSLDIVDFAST